MAPNLAIVSIPAYFLLSTAPHFLAIVTATGGSLSKFDNRNPRSTDLKERLKKTLPADQYNRYERLEACSANGLENMPLYIACVFAGLLADGVGKGGILAGNAVSDKTTRFIYSFFAARIAYSIAYATTADNKYTFIRSGIWMASLALAFEQLYRSAVVLGS